MNNPGAQAAAGLLFVLIIFVYPALCIGRIAAQLGRRPRRYMLGALVPLGSLVALGVLAFSAPQQSQPGAAPRRRS